MGVDSVQWAGWAVPPAVARGTAPLEPLMRAVTSVSVSTRGHSHMRGLVPQDGSFGGSGTGGSDDRAWPWAGCSQKGRGFAPHAAVTDPGDHQRSCAASRVPVV